MPSQPHIPHGDDIETAHRDVPLGRMRSRSVGEPRPGTPHVVVIQGMAVSDYLIPALDALGRWTRAHLVDLPGLSGSGESPRPLSLEDYAQAVTSWLERADLGPVVLVGHSSSTQVAGRAASTHEQGIVGLVLASPTFCPQARSWPRVLWRWARNNRLEDPQIGKVHRPEWRRAGPRRLVHLVATHLADRLEDSVDRCRVPVLVLRGRDDRLASPEWAHALARRARQGRFQQMPGAHSFPWSYPDAWSEPIRTWAQQNVDLEQGRDGEASRTAE